MKITLPDHFLDFCCIGGKCEDSCCIGWQVVLDEASATRFAAVEGELGDRLRAAMEVDADGETVFRLRENRRCPFLNGANLCDIHAALGETALCRTCRMFPRFEEEFGDLREQGLSFSCPEAARIMLRQQGQPAFLHSQNDEPVTRPNDFDPAYFDAIFAAREVMLSLIFNEDFSIETRICLLLEFAATLQKTVRRSNAAKAEKLTARFTDAAFLQKTAASFKHRPSPITAQLSLLQDKLEYLSDDLPRRFTASAAHPLPQEAEQLCWYFVYRYLLKGLYDGRLYEKVAFAAFSLAAVKHLLPEQPSPEEIQQLFSLYCKELEHSEENMAVMEDLLRRHRLFTKKNLITALLAT